MFQHLKRHLMTEVDAGSGNGAATPSPTTPVDSSPQAQGDAITLSKQDLSALVASAVSKAVGDVKAERDAAFAEARRVFTGKQSKAKTDDATAAAATPALDPIRLRSLDRELNKSGFATRLSDSQYQRVEKMFAMEAPEDVSGWVKDYFDGWGSAAPAQVPSAPVSQPASPTQPQQRTAPPVSDRGSPPVSAVPLEEQDILAMPPSDREALRRQKGDKWYTDRLLEQSKRHTFKLR